MATMPRAAQKGRPVSLEAKARTLVSLIRGLVESKDRLARRVDEQDARLNELNKRLLEVERSRTVAKERLKKLANQLPSD